MCVCVGVASVRLRFVFSLIHSSFLRLRYNLEKTERRIRENNEHYFFYHRLSEIVARVAIIIKNLNPGHAKS